MRLWGLNWACVCRDALHQQWEIRVVSLRGPYLCVHESEEDPFAPVESALVLGRNTFARTFADPGITAVAALAKKDYLHGIEVVTVDIEAKELQNFLLLAADGQQLADEWVEDIELQCIESLGQEPEAPAHDPTLTLSQLHVEAAGTNYPVAHRRKAAMMQAGLLSDEASELSPPESSRGHTETEYNRSSTSSGSAGETPREQGDSSNSSPLSSKSTDSEAAAEEALETVRAPTRPFVRRAETEHWEKEAVPGALFKRRQMRKKGELQPHRSDSSETVSETDDKAKEARDTPMPSSASRSSVGQSERESPVVKLVQNLERKAAARMQKPEHRGSSPEKGTDASTPDIGTLDIIPPPEVQVGGRALKGRGRDLSSSNEDTVARGSSKHTSNSSNKTQSSSNLNKSSDSAGKRRSIHKENTPELEFARDPTHGDAPPVQLRRQKVNSAPSAAAPAAAAPIRGAAVAAAAAAARGAAPAAEAALLGAKLNGVIAKQRHPTVSLTGEGSG